MSPKVRVKDTRIHEIGNSTWTETICALARDILSFDLCSINRNFTPNCESAPSQELGQAPLKEMHTRRY